MFENSRMDIFTCCAEEDMRSVLPLLKLEAALGGRDKDNFVVSAL